MGQPAPHEIPALYKKPCKNFLRGFHAGQGFHEGRGGGSVGGEGGKKFSCGVYVQLFLFGDSQKAFLHIVSTVGDSKKAVGSFDRFRSIDFFQPQNSLTFEGQCSRTRGPIKLRFAAKKYLDIFWQILPHADFALDLLIFLKNFYKFDVLGQECLILCYVFLVRVNSISTKLVL